MRREYHDFVLPAKCCRLMTFHNILRGNWPDGLLNWFGELLNWSDRPLNWFGELLNWYDRLLN